MECKICKDKKNVSEHDWDLKKSSDGHWLECSCGHKKALEDHVYDDDNDAICNVCSYERVLSVKSVKLNVTGYESGALIPQIKVAPTADSKGVDWNEDFCKYGTNGTYLISLNLLESVLYRELLIPEYETAYFMPNKQYYLSVYIFAKDGYSLENLSEENVNLSCGGTVGRYNKRRWSRRGRLLCKRRFYNVL